MKIGFVCASIGVLIAIALNAIFVYFNHVYAVLLFRMPAVIDFIFPASWLGVAPTGQLPGTWYFIVSPLVNGIYFFVIWVVVRFLKRSLFRA